MSENILTFIISWIISIFFSSIVFVWKVAEVKASVIKEIDHELNQLENSIIEINAKMELSNQQYTNDMTAINIRVTNLKNNIKSKIQDLKHIDNELINYIEKEFNPSHKFIIRNRDNSDDLDDSWTQLKTK